MSRLLIGTRKGLFVTTVEAGADLRVDAVHFAGDAVSAVLHDRRDGTIYAALGTGHYGAKLHRSDDGGATFAEIATPSYPPRPEGVDDINPNTGQAIPWNTELIWTLEAGHASRPGELWLGTIPGGVFRSSDRGDTWSLVEPLWNDPARAFWFGGGYDLPGVHSITVNPADADDVLLGVSCGGTWRTRDGGQTWAAGTGMRGAYMPPEQQMDVEIQDPHRLARCAAQPDVVWNQHHNGTFVSRNGGDHWDEITDIEPSTFGFAVAVHPHDPDTAWFVPADSDMNRVPVGGAMSISRTRDGGRTWEALRDGLPQHDAYHLVYRHGFEVDPTGDRLALGSTTGSLWVSHDQGDHVERLSADLPPIAVVHWA